MVLATAEKSGVHLISLQAQGQSLDKFVIQSAADRGCKRGVGIRSRTAVTDVSSSKESMSERSESSYRNRNPRSD